MSKLINNILDKAWVVAKSISDYASYDADIEDLLTLAYLYGVQSRLNTDYWKELSIYIDNINIQIKKK